MDRIIPDDIIDNTFEITTSVIVKDAQLDYFIHTRFTSVDKVQYDILIEHHDSGSIMLYYEDGKVFKYYFSPYMSQRYIKYMMLEYAKNKPNVDHKSEIISLINRIKQRNLSCKEIIDGEK